MPTSVELAKSQELAVEALIGSGSYRTQSEILRSAVDDFMRHVPKPKRLAAAVWAYEHGRATLSQAAALADMPHEEMHRTLVREGHFRSGTTAKHLEAETQFLSKNARPRAAKKRR